MLSLKYKISGKERYMTFIKFADGIYPACTVWQFETKAQTSPTHQSPANGFTKSHPWFVRSCIYSVRK
jgi:hypothetical protein